MSPRPRNKANKGLPENLYLDSRRGTYRYRRPTDGKWFPFGADRAKAINAAKQLNMEFIGGADLVSKVKGGSTDLFVDFLDHYKEKILPPRELAKGTLDLYEVRFRQFRKAWPTQAVNEITIRMIADLLDSLTPRAANQARALLVDIFNHAVAKGLCPDNPAICTIPKIEKKQRKRHTIEGLRAIREKAPAWLQNAIDLALITAQRRTDILAMRFDDVRDGFLYVVQQKTAKASDAAWIRFRVTPELQTVLSRCRDNIPSPFLIHRRPERKKQKQAEQKEHWTKIEERYLTRAFKDARDAAGCYAGWSEEEMPGFHEVRALSLHLYKKAGKDGQKIAGHASEEMTKNYQRDHEEVVWADAIPDLDISEFAR
ncbi:MULTISPECIES: tyrosine-type recombinase/integrase [unclassified Pseudomonas]|uniref:tyrosine-type recombinase/integrase n=1 Tax=unclassified Pseudomonas TaxID=196821 RepID=UPI0007307578|nr:MULTISPECIES: tyrosine-type recombinase/integrase [unclassified Pseudomonas]KSW22808.1 integrase [Pseudomonas sp. ADP]KSW28422.1 integrase [Pseudomonas sp. ADP]OBP13092.1 integrase [Pseudomonas sp. EGD-AKN5]QOF85628.1 phage integrase Arm DNA-binding domain-containing protein [Pseudomonas sp. ADPe]QOF85739.1 phage integrase Arm DNA-binding domain-containing protein [Pseudomonas sp. ADPe]